MPVTAAITLDFTTSNEFTTAQERMVLKKNLPDTAAITLDFTIPKRIHNCPRADGIKQVCPLQQQLPSTSQSPNEFTIVQERISFEKNLPDTAAITLDFTIPRRIHNCPRGGGIQKNVPATAAITLDFTIPQQIHNCPRAGGIEKKKARYSSNYSRLHNPPTNSQWSKNG